MKRNQALAYLPKLYHFWRKNLPVRITMSLSAVPKLQLQVGQPSVSDSTGYLTKTAQGQYCLLNVTANNIADQSQTLDSTSQYLYDSSNKKYSSDSEATIDVSPTDNTFFNPINPGNTVSGTIVFDIPKDVTSVTAELHDSALSGGVKVSLQ